MKYTYKGISRNDKIMINKEYFFVENGNFVLFWYDILQNSVGVNTLFVVEYASTDCMCEKFFIFQMIL